MKIATEATQFLFWEYINGIFVAVCSRPLPAGQIANDDFSLILPLVYYLFTLRKPEPYFPFNDFEMYINAEECANLTLKL